MHRGSHELLRVLGEFEYGQGDPSVLYVPLPQETDAETGGPGPRAEMPGSPPLPTPIRVQDCIDALADKVRLGKSPEVLCIRPERCRLERGTRQGQHTGGRQDEGRLCFPPKRRTERGGPVPRALRRSTDALRFRGAALGWSEWHREAMPR